MSTMRIGVLALQGSFAEHIQSFRRLGAPAHEIRLPEHLEGLRGLVIPGGESTTMSRLLTEYGLLSPLSRMIAAGFHDVRVEPKDGRAADNLCSAHISAAKTR